MHCELVLYLTCLLDKVSGLVDKKKSAIQWLKLVVYCVVCVLLCPDYICTHCNHVHLVLVDVHYRTVPLPSFTLICGGLTSRVHLLSIYLPDSRWTSSGSLNGELRFQRAMSLGGQRLFTESRPLFTLWRCQTQMHCERLSLHLVYVCPGAQEDALAV